MKINEIDFQLNSGLLQMNLAYTFLIREKSNGEEKLVKLQSVYRGVTYVYDEIGLRPYLTIEVLENGDTISHCINLMPDMIESFEKNVALTMQYRKREIECPTVKK